MAEKQRPNAVDWAAQEAEWERLHDQIIATLEPFGEIDPFLGGDYWLVDDYWGPKVQRLEFKTLQMLRPEIIELLQSLLVPYPDWYITVRVFIPDKKDWPGMGLFVYSDEVVDELQRDYLPPEFREMTFGKKLAR